MRISRISWSLTGNLSKMILACFVTILLVSQRAALAAGDDPADGTEAQPLEIIDAQAFHPNQTPGIADDPTSAVDSKWKRTGVFADGTSVLVIRLKTPQTGSVTFSIKHLGTNEKFLQTSTFDGSLWAFDPTHNNKGFPGIPTPDPDPSVPDNMGQRSAQVSGPPYLVYYRPPNSFFFGGLALKQTILLSVTAGGNEIADTSFDLVRPTIFLSHGITNVASGMEAIKSALNPLVFENENGPKVLDILWDAENTAGLDVASKFIYSQIEEEVWQQRKHGIAATRVDFVGHSQGGLNAKWYIANLGTVTQPRNDGFPDLKWSGDQTHFCRDRNFGIGDIRRLDTIGSPLRGSPIMDLASQVLGRTKIRTIATTQGWGEDSNGFEDLGMQSNAMKTLNAWTKYPSTFSWCPIVGIASKKTEADFWKTRPWWQATLLHAAGGSLHHLHLDATNSDFCVENASAINATVFLPGTSFKYDKEGNVFHGEEPTLPNIVTYVTKTLDVDSTSLDAPGAGYGYFNKGF